MRLLKQVFQSELQFSVLEKLSSNVSQWEYVSYIGNTSCLYISHKAGEVYYFLKGSYCVLLCWQGYKVFVWLPPPLHLCLLPHQCSISHICCPLVERDRTALVVTLGFCSEPLIGGMSGWYTNAATSLRDGQPLLSSSFSSAQPLALIYNPTVSQWVPPVWWKESEEMYVCSAPLQPPRQPPGMTLLLPVAGHVDKLSGSAGHSIKTTSKISKRKAQST